ncbi:glycosyltransferase family 2 protein [Corynebacterium tuberculostearicum]|uniref:glycosyltransferase family 2 protein n=1 Tax=Corynebacterium TaxID=1716 RepID=UPI001EF28637|nr:MULTISPECIES: glycosyltransferase family 2 protein [Corynebacterium]MCG7461636.1 glycosyltransferase family 92 protein [Corynebacterium sp. ACRPF]MDV2417787.1 glycosyltransferase family 2 protein [Corynebacterium tuberculostearicum]
MDLHILTMSRGDAYRLRDWVLYHHEIGFNYFHIILDAPNDESENVLKEISAAVPLNLDITVKEANGSYFDNLSPEEKWTEVKKWRSEHAEYINNSGLPIVDPLSDRQYKYLPEKLAELSESFPEDWVAVIDVDEYIALPSTSTLKSIIKNAKSPRLRLLNFNFDMSNWTPDQLVRNQVHRWAREDIVEYGKGWDNRVKSIVKISEALPMSSVHSISRGSFERLPEETARLHHYKHPNQSLGLEYSVLDPTIAPENRK